MNTQTLTAALILTCSSLALPACTSSPRPVTGQPLSVRALTGEWRLVSIGSDAVTDLLQQGGEAPTIRIEDDGRLTGSAGVNRIAGSLDAEAILSGRWSTTPLIATKMAGPDHLTALENRVLAALNRATAIKLEGQTLTLEGRAAETLVFTAGE